MKKIILTIIIVVITIVIAIPATFLIGVYCNERELQRTKTEYEKQATININTYLKEKYPNMEFVITEINVDESYNGFVQAGWHNVVDVVVKDKDGKTYNCVTDASLTGKEGIANSRDDVQAEEIKSTIISRVYKSISVTTTEYISDTQNPLLQNKRCDFKFFNTGHGTLYHTKFNGDIISFLKTEHNGYNKPIEPCMWVVYNKGELHISDNIDTEFLDLLEFVAFIEVENELPNSDFYAFTTAESIISFFKGQNNTIETLYFYDKSAKTFIDYLETRTITV